MQPTLQDMSAVQKMARLLREIHVKPIYVAVPLVLAVIAALFDGVTMGLLIPILSGFLEKNFSFVINAPYIGPIIQQLPDSIVHNDRMLFGVLLGGFIAVYVLRNTLRYLSVVSMAYFSERVLHHLRKTVFARYMSFGKLFFDTTSVGHHHTVLLEFSQMALRPIISIDRFANALFSVIAYGVVMLMISWELTLVALPLFILLHFVVRFMIRNLKEMSRSIAEQGSRLGMKSVEILSTIALVKSHRTERQEQDAYTAISNKKSMLDYHSRALQELILPLQEIITLIAAAAIFIGALALFGRDDIASAPALIVYFYVVINASSKFGSLAGYRGSIAAASGPLDVVLGVFEDEQKFFVRGGPEQFTGVQNAIEFKNLSFSYSHDRSILQNVTFTVNKGEMTAIVGPTGAGKSTLMHLLMRFYDCPPGTILIDGTDIRNFSLDSYLSRVAIVSQETLLLHDSLRQNILYGLKSVSESALENAIEKARLKDFIGHLPQGLETLIGDRGVKLSGGEKQRLSIARALLRNADILLLDEATSSLDSETERLVQEAIQEAVHGRTSVVIAHRLSTIRNADAIVVLANGEVAQRGTLDELTQTEGLFQRLWQEQKF